MQSSFSKPGISLSQPAILLCRLCFELRGTRDAIILSQLLPVSRAIWVKISAHSLVDDERRGLGDGDRTTGDRSLPHPERQNAYPKRGCWTRRPRWPHPTAEKLRQQSRRAAGRWSDAPPSRYFFDAPGILAGKIQPGVRCGPSALHLQKFWRLRQNSRGRDKRSPGKSDLRVLPWRPQ